MDKFIKDIEKCILNAQDRDVSLDLIIQKLIDSATAIEFICFGGDHQQILIERLLNSIAAAENAQIGEEIK